MVGTTRGFKLHKGDLVKIYAKGLTNSEYVMSVRDPIKTKQNLKEWRSKNKDEYNEYMRNYYHKNK